MPRLATTTSQTGTTTSGTLRDASLEPGKNPWPYSSVSDEGGFSVWYRLAVAAPTPVELDGCEMTEAELQLGAYTGSSVTALEPAGVGGCIADFDAQPGEYRIRVDGEFDTSFNLKIQPVP